MGVPGLQPAAQTAATTTKTPNHIARVREHFIF